MLLLNRLPKPCLILMKNAFNALSLRSFQSLGNTFRDTYHETKVFIYIDMLYKYSFVVEVSVYPAASFVKYHTHIHIDIDIKFLQMTKAFQLASNTV